MAATYASVATACILGGHFGPRFTLLGSFFLVLSLAGDRGDHYSFRCPRAFELIDRPGLYRFLLHAKDPITGTFRVTPDGYLQF